MPLSFIFVPLMLKPVAASNANVRMPRGDVYVSTTEPPAETVVTTEYIVGDEGDQSLGLDTVTVCATLEVAPAATEVAAEVAVPTSVPAASRTELVTETDAALAESFCTVTLMFTVALDAETVGVLTCVPVYATRTGFTVFNHV